MSNSETFGFVYDSYRDSWSNEKLGVTCFRSGDLEAAARWREHGGPMPDSVYAWWQTPDCLRMPTNAEVMAADPLGGSSRKGMN